jgi:hypothetical protein
MYTAGDDNAMAATTAVAMPPVHERLALGTTGSSRSSSS